MIDAARGATARYGEDEIDETVAFLEWLRANHFVLLGSRDYSIYDVDGTPCFMAVRGSGLGVLQDEGTTGYAEPMPVADLPAIVLTRLIEGELLGISKTPYHSTVHRRARMDDIGIKKIDTDGEVVGLIRIVGLFTSLAYMEQAARTPLLRRKLRRLVQSRGADRGLARLQGCRRHLRVVPARRAVPGPRRGAAPRGDGGARRRGGAGARR